MGRGLSCFWRLRSGRVIGYPDDGVVERGHVPRFAVDKGRASMAERAAEGSGTGVTVTDAFDRAVGALAHDPRFSGVEIVAHAARRNHGSAALSVTIDRAGGVDLATCERIAATLNATLEPCAQAYTLEVESAGLNRALTKPGDYERFSGRTAKVVTTLLVHGSKTHRGVLRGVRGSSVILETERGELPLPLAAIKSAHLEYDIRSDLKRNKEERKHHG
jgi:ribosome maturation factor RimP